MKTVKDFMKKEADAIDQMVHCTGAQYDAVITVLSKCSGKIAFIGIGKSGHIAEKLAATFSSTGTPSFFVHAAECVHGDLGVLQNHDVAVLISNSGATRELITLLPAIAAIGCKTVAFTSEGESPLAKGCNYSIVYPKCEEADHLNLAPTVSSTLALVLGDAIACVLSQNRNFKREDFFLYHPAGALGAKLAEEQNK